MIQTACPIRRVYVVSIIGNNTEGGTTFHARVPTYFGIR